MNNPQPPQTPWQSHEKVELLTEAIRQSRIPPEHLVQFIQANGIIPNWGDMVLPRGRTMNQAVAAYDDLTRSRSNIMRSASVREFGPSTAMKRPFTSEAAAYGGRMIQPRPEGAPLASPREPSEPARKKRGRPTKAEAEERRQAAILRGEPWPPARRASTFSAVPGPSSAVVASLSSTAVAGPSSAPLPRPSSAVLPRPQSVAAAQAAYGAAVPRAVKTPPPQSAGPPSSSSSSGKRKRGRPAKAIQESHRPQESVALAPHPGPSRYPDILSREDPPPDPRTQLPKATSAHPTGPGGPPGRQ